MDINMKLETALRRKLRFPFRGNATVEDLWYLTEVQLDTLYRTLVANRAPGEGLIDHAKADSDEELRLDLVRHVFETKRAEAAARRERADRQQRKQRILAIIEDKQEGELREKSVEDLKKLLDEG